MRSSPLSHRRFCGSGVQSVLSQARSFSSTQRRPAQELFPDIKRKLTREAEKVINKERLKAAPVYAAHLDEQLQFLVEVCTNALYLVASLLTKPAAIPDARSAETGTQGSSKSPAYRDTGEVWAAVRR